MRYCCMRPEWAEDDTCLLDTGEYDDCSECAWACELEDDDDD